MVMMVMMTTAVVMMLSGTVVMTMTIIMGVPLILGVLIMGILLFRVLYQGPPFLETPSCFCLPGCCNRLPD